MQRLQNVKINEVNQTSTDKQQKQIEIKEQKITTKLVKESDNSKTKNHDEIEKAIKERVKHN